MMRDNDFVTLEGTLKPKAEKWFQLDLSALPSNSAVVTPEMLEAGVNAYFECDRENDFGIQIVEAILTAAMRARRA